LLDNQSFDHSINPLFDFDIQLQVDFYTSNEQKLAWVKLGKKRERARGLPSQAVGQTGGDIFSRLAQGTGQAMPLCRSAPARLAGVAAWPGSCLGNLAHSPPKAGPIWAGRFVLPDLKPGLPQAGQLVFAKHG
jgi:hypothetical protein